MYPSDTIEDKLPSLYADARGFWRDGIRFFPCIPENWQETALGNTIKIILPADAQHDLNWEEQRLLAQQSIHAGKLIVWEIAWNYTDSKNSLSFFTDTAAFSAQTFVLQQWGVAIAPHFKDHTLGVILYQGPICPVLPDVLKERYQEWLEGSQDTFWKRRLYASSILYEYLHRLGSFLPDAVPVLALVDAKEVKNPAEQAFIFSNERTGYLQLAVQNACVPLTGLCWQHGESKGGWIGQGTPPKDLSDFPDITIGVCLPSEEYYHQENMENFSLLLDLLEKAKIPYRFIPEAFLNEQWDGLDYLLVIETALTPKGKRMLQGFIAAGGEIVGCQDQEEIKEWIKCIQ